MLDATSLEGTVYRFLSNAELAGATAPSVSQAATTVELVIARTAISPSPWHRGPFYESTAASETAPIAAAAQRQSDDLLMAISELRDLREGWDGENAAPARPRAITDALHLVAGLGNEAKALEPTLHVNGSVLLEIDGGSGGGLLFSGDGTAAYYIQGFAPSAMQLAAPDFASLKRMLSMA